MVRIGKRERKLSFIFYNLRMLICYLLLNVVSSQEQLTLFIMPSVLPSATPRFLTDEQGNALYAVLPIERVQSPSRYSPILSTGSERPYHRRS